ncbi:MAG: hypothetical protein H6625_04290 [Bdellovibrionaceae bacterium]|nr:hypothetical protein [Pseudobdellovibrionaceae bacterium]
MNSASVVLTQSKFYSPVFNAAIFDGPIKIYFSQMQEGLALQLYFQLQRKINDSKLDILQNKDSNIFVMLYPNTESFLQTFNEPHQHVEQNEVRIIEDYLGTDPVIGVCGPADDNTLECVYKKIKEISFNVMPDFLEKGAGA